ncbi:MAG: acetylglutamate kinase [Luteitalea sp.]|nr:acetylglutamate kinase [Luteitalea sp.]
MGFRSATACCETSPETEVETAVQVVKLGGELLEEPARVAALAGRLARLAQSAPLAVVHGGGREIDAELSRRGLAKRAVDGLRVTDRATLDAVVAVLGGLVNTRLVSALVAEGARAVGLTGVDGAWGLAEKAPPHQATDGRLIDLGLVGMPIGQSRTSLLSDLIGLGYVPVVASLGVDAGGQVLNINADTLAAHVASILCAKTLWVAGSTPGVLDSTGETIATLTGDEAHAMMADGSASAGMVAKLTACLSALDSGVSDVRIIDGRDEELDTAPGTRVMSADGETGPEPRPSYYLRR